MVSEVFNCTILFGFFDEYQRIVCNVINGQHVERYEKNSVHLLLETSGTVSKHNVRIFINRDENITYESSESGNE